MTKNTKKISFLDYSILFISLIFFSIVYFYSSIIWPREEKFKNIDRSRMERLDNAQKLYNVLTDDYLEDASTLFALMEAIRDTLDGDEFFEGKKDVVLANKYKQYVIKDIFGDLSNNDTVLVNESEVKSFEFSEGVKLYSKYIYSNMDSSIFNTSISLEKIQEKLISELVTYSTNSNANGSDFIYGDYNEPDFDCFGPCYSYTMDERNQFIEQNIYPIGFFYKNFVDGQVLNEQDLSDLTYSLNIPAGFKNRLDTTFTKPIKVEEKYKENIFAVRVMNFDPTDNFLDIGNGIWDDAEEYIDENNNNIWDPAEQFTENNGRYDEGEEYVDLNNNGKWDPADSFEDNKNGKYDIGEIFKDVKNGKYDEGEEFEDRGNGIWDEGEYFYDIGNGKYDLGEKFEDFNGNGIWDDAEKFTDINDDDVWNISEPFTDNVICNGEWDDAEKFYDEGNGKYDQGEEFEDFTNGKWDKGESFKDRPNGKYDEGEEFIDGDGIWTMGEKLLKDYNNNGKWDPAEDFTDFNGEYNLGEDFLDCTWIKGNKVCNDTWWRKFIANGIRDESESFVDKNDNGKWDPAEDFFDSVNGKYDLGEKFIDANSNGKWDNQEVFTDSKNGKYDQGEEFVDKGNGVHDFGEIYFDINYLNSDLHDEYKLKESYLGYLPNQDTLYTIFDSNKNENITIPSYQYKKEYKDSEIKGIEKIDYKIVERKRVYMDYLSKSDTLTIDSLYSSINFFKNNYSEKDLFNISINRYEDQFYFLNLEKSFDPDCSVVYPANFPQSQNETMYFQEIEVSLPFIDEKIEAVIYFTKLDNPSLVIQSPVPNNEYWSYWHKFYSIDIEDIEMNKYSKSTFSIPTPFSFYTGDPGTIENHSKSWTD